MVVLKKIKASTLMETLVATVLIVIIFMLASIILNNIFSNTIKNNTRAIEAYLNELEYLKQNDKLQLPFKNTVEYWDVSVENYTENNQTMIEFEAQNRDTKKTISRQYIENK